MFLKITLRALPAVLFCASLLPGCASQKMLRSAGKELLADPVINAAHIGISIYDAETGKYVYDYQGDQYFVPASNIKIPSCYAALKYLGDSLTALRYVVAGPDTVYIEGMGSPDLLHSDFPQQNVYSFLKRFKRVVWCTKPYTDYLGNGWAWNDYREYYMAQRSQLPLYGNVVKFHWQNDKTISATPSFFERVKRIEEKPENGFSIEKPWEKNEFTFYDGDTRNRSEERRVGKEC